MTNEQVMYIGPTLRGIAKSGAVFSGGIPKKLEKLAAEKPIIKKLIVPISGIVQAKIRMIPYTSRLIFITNRPQSTILDIAQTLKIIRCASPCMRVLMFSGLHLL